MYVYNDFRYALKFFIYKYKIDTFIIFKWESQLFSSFVFTLKVKVLLLPVRVGGLSCSFLLC